MKPGQLARLSFGRPQIASGKLRVLAVATSSRAQAVPDLPTVAEAGVPDFKADVCFGVVAPAGMPGEIIAKLNQELVAVMHMPDVGEQLRRQGIEPFVQRLVRIDLFGPVAARPCVNGWYARVTSRPAYASAMPPAGSEGGQPAPG